MSISDDISNVFYTRMEQMIITGSHYKASDVSETVFYELYYEGKRNIPQFNLQKFSQDSLNDNKTTQNYSFVFDDN